jgi:glycosyltransferase involved in cell wall biosynthesis
MVKLSILIPTLPERVSHLRRLKNILEPQVARYPGQVEIKVHDAGRGMSTGKKRNELINLSEGEYFCQIDDDDQVPIYYVQELMSAIEKNPDVITFIGYMTTDGANRQDFTIKLGSKYDTIKGHHYRFPNHLCCYKRSVVQHIKFQDITIGEDYQWALDIQRKRLLRTEVHIEKEMYHYCYESRKPNYSRVTHRRIR